MSVFFGTEINPHSTVKSMNMTSKPSDPNKSLSSPVLVPFATLVPCVKRLDCIYAMKPFHYRVYMVPSSELYSVAAKRKKESGLKLLVNSLANERSFSVAYKPKEDHTNHSAYT